MYTFLKKLTLSSFCLLAISAFSQESDDMDPILREHIDYLIDRYAEGVESAPTGVDEIEYCTERALYIVTVTDNRNEEAREVQIIDPNAREPISDEGDHDPFWNLTILSTDQAQDGVEHAAITSSMSRATQIGKKINLNTYVSDEWGDFEATVNKFKLHRTECRTEGERAPSRFTYSIGVNFRTSN